LPEKEISWVNSGVSESFTPKTTFSNMLISFLSDQSKFNLKVDFNLTTNLTNEKHTFETIPIQSFVLSDYNKSFVCTGGRCGEQEPLGAVQLPTKAQVISELSDNNFTVELLLDFTEAPLNTTCFRIIESKMINCFYDDGILAYIGDDSIHIKVKDIQKDVLTDANFILPHIPTLTTVDNPIIPKEPAFNCKGITTGFEITNLYYQTDLNAFSIKVANNSGKRIYLISYNQDGDFSNGGISYQDFRNGASQDFGPVIVSQNSLPYPKGTITLYYTDSKPEPINPKVTNNGVTISDVPTPNGSVTITCSGKLDKFD
jgi:hypothetical protein